MPVILSPSQTTSAGTFGGDLHLPPIAAGERSEQFVEFLAMEQDALAPRLGAHDFHEQPHDGHGEDFRQHHAAVAHGPIRGTIVVIGGLRLRMVEDEFHHAIIVHRLDQVLLDPAAAIGRVDRDPFG